MNKQRMRQDEEKWECLDEGSKDGRSVPGAMLCGLEATPSALLGGVHCCCFMRQQRYTTDTACVGGLLRSSVVGPLNTVLLESLSKGRP